jgi:hypothetical protein
MRKELGGDRCWWPSMGRFGEVGAREPFLVRMGWACGSLFVWGGRILEGLLSLIQVRALKFAFGMMYGVGIGLSRRRFQACTALLA